MPISRDDRTLLALWLVVGLLGSAALAHVADAGVVEITASPEWPRSRPVALADGYADDVTPTPDTGWEP